MEKDPKKAIKEMIAQVGKRETLRLLVIEGCSPSTAEKLAALRYDSDVGTLLSRAIIRAHEALKKGIAS